MAIIRKDKYGLYAIAGGWYVRPYDTKEAFGYSHLKEWIIGKPFARKGLSRYQEGDRITAKHYGGTPIARVGDECWFLHGLKNEITNTKPLVRLHSETAWNPA